MNYNVNKLLDVDKRARQMLDEAQQYYERTLVELKGEKRRMRDDYTEKARLHLERLAAEQADEVTELVAAVRERTAALMEAMDARYDELHKQWEDELIARTIGRDPG